MFYFKRLLLMRNVWGNAAWIGAWSEGSCQWSQVPPEQIPSQGTGSNADGVFWIAANDFFRLVIV